jgi:hypothetical protein
MWRAGSFLGDVRAGVIAEIRGLFTRATLRGRLLGLDLSTTVFFSLNGPTNLPTYRPTDLPTYLICP